MLQSRNVIYSAVMLHTEHEDMQTRLAEISQDTMKIWLNPSLSWQ